MFRRREKNWNGSKDTGLAVALYGVGESLYVLGASYKSAAWLNLFSIRRYCIRCCRFLHALCRTSFDFGSAFRMGLSRQYYCIGHRNSSWEPLDLSLYLGLDLSTGHLDGCWRLPYSMAELEFTALFGNIFSTILAMDLNYLMKFAWPVIGPMLAGAIPTALTSWFVFYFLSVFLLKSVHRSRLERKGLIHLSEGRPCKQLENPYEQ